MLIHDRVSTAVDTVDNSPADAFRRVRAQQNPAPKIGTVEMVDEARRAIVSTVARWQGDEGPRWRVTISPGAMRLGRKNYAALNASAERGREDVATLWNDGVARPTALRDTAEMTLAPERAKRSVISAWSTESRTRMSYVLKTLDYSPLFENNGMPALVTLTMPANWEEITPTPKAFKNLLNRFLDRYRYAWGERLAGVWKMEFQLRGAPHLHVLMTPPTFRRPGSGETFSAWLAVNWAQLCQPESFDANDPKQWARRVDHQLMGTHIDYSKGLQGHSPDMVAAYFSKHGLFGAKDYQNDPPELWREAVKQSGGVRFWGYWVLKKALGVIDLNPITPHYVKSKSHYRFARAAIASPVRKRVALKLVRSGHR